MLQLLDVSIFIMSIKSVNLRGVMSKKCKFLALGLMSGTSMDGVDIALVETDGNSVTFFGPSETRPYSNDFKLRLRQQLGKKQVQKELETELTLFHAKVVEEFLVKNQYSSSDIDVIGFHGHTILHQPDIAFTLQIGNGSLLRERLGIAVVNNFRAADIAAGGNGAPLAPIYHRALSERFAEPLVIVNIGGVANVTYTSGEHLIGFDCGPGNAPIDDLLRYKIGVDLDQNGRYARRGKVDEEILSKLLLNAYFYRPPPKTLDRGDFDFSLVKSLAVEDGAATLVEFIVNAIIQSVDHFPQITERWMVTGGGRKNLYLMEQLSKCLGFEVKPVEDVGWDGDALEAQAFAFLAVRSILELPISFPSTTGVSRELTGGDIFLL